MAHCSGPAFSSEMDERAHWPGAASRQQDLNTQRCPKICAKPLVTLLCDVRTRYERRWSRRGIAVFGATTDWVFIQLSACIGTLLYSTSRPNTATSAGPASSLLLPACYHLQSSLNPEKTMASSNPSIPPTMRAWLRPTRGPAATALKLSTTQPTPTVAPDSADVLVRVSYSALQFSGEWALQSLPALPGAPPRIPELEFSGVVAAAGSRAPPELREVGARVVAAHTIPSVILFGYGALAEYVKVSADQTVRLPDSIDLTTASGMVGCGSTALKMVRAAAVGHGDRVLVNGASSSVGSVLVQICKMKGATVVGTASGANQELVRGLGVDEVRFSKSSIGCVLIWLFC